ncbi:FliI/YscN family ATPase [Pseudoalteromonas sp. SMS1]|uniref:FliI/YscN family ATPase n=1 Tax=Pseudoalteromonas sp. SMS1 TaxID=2908894 RepID=UPI001F2816AD|nr:FliI/YscN family ATPase [Pseudoalteromonas sp. SMS1]MCF2860225.1 FliI/YscN family ATPase [Pseudoalteromonas sp. SMS1]
MSLISLYKQSLEKVNEPKAIGRVTQVIGLTLEVVCPDLFIGEICHIELTTQDRYVVAEVVGLKKETAILMPFEKAVGITLGSKVVPQGRSAQAKVGQAFLGRVVNAFGEPIDDKGPIAPYDLAPIHKPAINPLSRAPVDTQFSTGLKVVDACLPIGQGQRVGLFAGSGVGKSSLLSGICKYNLDQQKVNIIVLVGERGREVAEFVHETLGPDGLKHSVVIVATAEEPALIRAHAVYTAMAMAEFFSHQQRNVFLSIDSMTRFAFALREIGLAVGEPPTVKGYTSSVFSILPSIVERCGNFQNRGAITALLSVLVEGDDLNDPVVDSLRAILDGHVVLDRALAEKNHYPAVSVLKSVSRMFNRLTTAEQKSDVKSLRHVLSLYDDNKMILELGMLESSQSHIEQIKSDYQVACGFLQQDLGTYVSSADAKLSLNKLKFGGASNG